MERITRSSVAVFIAVAMVLAPLAVAPAFADQATDEARAHYARGKQLFAQADYRAAISEFAQANALAPSPVLEFNIGLCHDRLGDKSEAVRRYQQYVAQLPSAANRAKVEARVAQLEGELVAEQAAAAEAEAAKAEPVPPVVAPAPVPSLDDPPPAPEPQREPEIAPPTSLAPPASVGDEALDRVNRIDIGQIRGRYQGTSSPRAVEPPPAAPPPSARVAPAPDGTRGAGASRPAPPPRGDRGSNQSKSKPAYKQWWFWVVIGVSAIILIDIASSDSSSDEPSQRGLLLPSPGEAESGPVLFRF